MSFVEKIDKILKAKGITLSKLSRLTGLHSTLEKAYADDREMKEGSTERLLKNFGISALWWTEQTGPMFTEKSIENSVAVRLNPTGLKEMASNGDYICMHAKVWANLENEREVIKTESALLRKERDDYRAEAQELRRICADLFEQLRERNKKKKSPTKQRKAGD